MMNIESPNIEFKESWRDEYLNEHPNATRKELCKKIPDMAMGGRKQGYWQIIE